MTCGSPFFVRRYEYATAPLPPGLFTTLTGTVTIFSLVRILAMVRAKISLPPPAAAWTTNSMGRSGFQLEAGTFGTAVALWAANAAASGAAMSTAAIFRHTDRNEARRMMGLLGLF